MVYFRARTAVVRPEPSNTWWVSNGDAVVGPVSLDLLLRGVAHGRVSPDCMVRESQWNQWRYVMDLRELRRPESQADLEAEIDAMIAPATDMSEVVLLALSAASRRTRAQVGLGHRSRRALGPLLTLYCHGEGCDDQLGQFVPAEDAALRSARYGCTVVQRPLGNSAGAAACRRLASGRLPLRGVAWAPIHHRGRLFALLELGRADRGFRQNDVDALRVIARASGRHLARLSTRS